MYHLPRVCHTMVPKIRVRHKMLRDVLTCIITCTRLNKNDNWSYSLSAVKIINEGRYMQVNAQTTLILLRCWPVCYFVDVEPYRLTVRRYHWHCWPCSYCYMNIISSGLPPVFHECTRNIIKVRHNYNNLSQFVYVHANQYMYRNLLTQKFSRSRDTRSLTAYSSSSPSSIDERSMAILSVNSLTDNGG